MVAFSPDGTKAYVANDDGTVTPITIASDTPGTAITVGTSPWGVAFSPDGAKAYVANNADGTVTPITVASDTPDTPMTAGTKPQNIAFAPDGVNAYVSNQVSNSVTPIAVATNAPGGAFSVGSSPGGLAITPDQAPVASYTTGAAVINAATAFDASASTVAYGSITNYHWGSATARRRTRARRPRATPTRPSA